jgi:hypothetical protein
VTRRRARTAAGAVAGLLALAGAPAALAAGQYSVTPITGPGATVEQGNAINAAGDVVGLAKFGSSVPTCGFLWHAGTLSALPAAFANGSHGASEPGCNGSGSGGDEAWAINNSGLVAGFADYEPTTTRISEASTWQDSTGPALLGSGCGQALAVDASGTLGGTCSTDAWLGSQSNIIAPGSPSAGGRGDAATIAVNELDQAIVYYDAAGTSPGTRPSAALYPGLTALPVVPGVFYNGTVFRGGAGALNASSVAVGGITAGSGPSTTIAAAYAQSAGAAVTLPPVSGKADAIASAVNDGGDVVGASFGAAAAGPVATLWPAAAPPASGSAPTGVDLNTLIPAGSGITLQSASAINVSGQILAEGIAAGNPEWVVLTPSHLLSVTVSTPADGGAPLPKIGDTVPVTVTVAESASATSDITNLAFAGQPLQWTPSGGLTPVDGPTPPGFSPASLSPGSSQSFTFHVKVQQPGTTVLTSQVTGTYQSQSLSATGEDTITPQTPLVTTVTVDQNPIKLDTAPDGSETPQPFTATIKLFNPLSVPVNNVSLTNPLTVEDLQAQGDVEKPVKQNGNPNPSASVGTIQPLSTATLTVPYSAVGDGNAKIDAVVTYSNPFAAGNLTSTGNVKVLVNPQALLELQYHVASNGSLNPAGQPFSVLGTLKNITNSAIVHVDPLQPTLNGNVGGANPFDVDKPFPPVDKFVLPWSGALGGGNQLSFQAVAQTVPGFGTRATIGYAPTGTVDLPDGTTRALTAADIITTDPSGGSVIASIDDSVPPPSKATAATVIGSFSEAAFVASNQWIEQNLQALKSVGGAAFDLVHTAHISSVIDTAEYLYQYFTSLTAAQRDDYLTQVAADVLDQTTQFGTNLAAVKAAVTAAVQGWENRFVAAWVAGDWNAVAAQLGAISANTLLEAATWFVHLPKYADVIKAADALRATEAAQKLASSVNELIEGENLLTKAGSPLRTIFGMDDGQIAQLIALAKEKGVQIAMRFRNPKSAYWIEQFGALAKPENIKLKSVNDIDFTFLGYRPADEALAVLKPPISRSQLARNLIDHQVSDSKIIAAVTKRWVQRSQEYKELLPLYEKYEKEGIELGFDYGGQGVLHEPSVFTRRQFSLSQVAGEPKSYRIVKVANQSGSLKLVTGDLDAVAITHSDGTMLDEAERVDLYQQLQRINDAQHGATFDWFKNGELGSETQLKLLSDHDPGKQLLAVFDPAGNVTAQYIDPALTVFDKQKLGAGRPGVRACRGLRRRRPQPHRAPARRPEPRALPLAL